MIDDPKRLSTPAVLLLGEPGSGKTFSIGTLAQRKKIFYLFTDPGGDESLIDALAHYKVPLTNVHWHYVSPAVSSWDGLFRTAETINLRNYKDLAESRGTEKGEHKQMLQMISSLADFTDDRTGQSFGDAATWGDDCALVIDSISGLNQLCKELAVGSKPTLHQGEWGVAMAFLESYIRKVVSSIQAFLVIIGHLESQRDEMTGRRYFTAALLGNKLASTGVVVRQFSDIIHTRQESGKFLWSTTSSEIALKSRNLPLKDNLPPDFNAIVDSYERRKKQLQEAEIPTGIDAAAAS
jgi:hypothetical protein